MLFRKGIPRSCQYCSNCTALEDNQMLCTKCGVVSMYYACRHFRYDPCKRIPARQKPVDFEKFKDEDFSL